MLRINRKTQDGPLQIVHDFHFTALNVRDDYSALLSMGEQEKCSAMKERVRSLYDKGFGGIVLNVDYVNYLKNDAAFDRLYAVAAYAKSLGMRVWIYDEQYYPSGSAGGLTLREHPECEVCALSLVTTEANVTPGDGAIRLPSPMGHSPLQYALAVPMTQGVPDYAHTVNVSHCRDLAGGLCFDAPLGHWKVYCFFVRVLFEATKMTRATRASRRYVSMLSDAAVDRFLDVTYRDGYEAHCPGKLGEFIDAVFTDEPYQPICVVHTAEPGKRTAFPSFSLYDTSFPDIPVYPFIPWESSLPGHFRERFGYDIADILIDLFEETPNAGQARQAFYRLKSDRMRAAFLDRYRSRMNRAGVGLSGHYYGEESFGLHPVYSGDFLAHLGSMDIPGCDNLKSAPDALRHCLACKLAGSAGHLYGKDRIMIEASNMTDRDQELTLQGAKAAISMMFVHGINLITSYYSENLFPPQQMRAFTDHIAALTSLFSGGRYEVDTFLYYPFEELCARCAPQRPGVKAENDPLSITETAKALFSRQILFDFVNRECLLGCEIREGFLLAPNGCRIRQIVLPCGVTPDESLADYLYRAEQQDIDVLYGGDLLSGKRVPHSSGFLRVEGAHEGITAMCCSHETHDLFLLVNTFDAPCSISVTIPCPEGSVFSRFDPESGAFLPISCRFTPSGAVFDLQPDALCSVILCREAKR